MTYFGEKKLGNFRPTATERQKAKQVNTREDREGNDDKHLAALRKCPCVITLKTPAGESHHLKNGTGERGMGMRSTDRWALPLSRIPHDELERVGSRNETKWFAERGIPAPLDLAERLWKASPDVIAMTKIILMHHEGR